MLRAAKSNPAAFWATAVILTGSVVLLLAHLGTYALWDDESLTAMTAGSVWRTGDTSAWVDGHNLLAYNNGLLIKGFFDRYSPPLQFYYLAPFIGLMGKSTFICRLPFAICGLLTVCLILRWMWRTNLPAMVWWAAAIIILTDAEFFLFNRQCRYYALAMLFSVAVAYCYDRWLKGDPSRPFIVTRAAGASGPCERCMESNAPRSTTPLAWAGGPYHDEASHNRPGVSQPRASIIPLMFALLALLVSHYLNYAAVVACLVTDYALWGRHRRSLLRREWLTLIVPQLLLGAMVCSIWNPAARSATAAAAGRAGTLGAAEYASTAVPFASLHWFGDYLTLFGWNCRDMLASGFFIVPLLLACPLLYVWKKNTWLLRAPVTVFIFIAMIALLTTHPIRGAGDAEVRYLAPLLPLGIGVGILAAWAIEPLKKPFKFALLGSAAITIFVAPPEPDASRLGSATSIRFYHELWQPQREPYTPVAAWINTNTAPGATVYVQPAYMTYPLMFHADQALYAWQLPDPPKPEYASINQSLIKGRIAPEWLIAFGPGVKAIDATRATLATRGIRYEKVDTIHVFWHDLFRPERINRMFTTVNPGPGEEVYVYHRLPAFDAGRNTAALQP